MSISSPLRSLPYLAIVFLFVSSSYAQEPKKAPPPPPPPPAIGQTVLGSYHVNPSGFVEGTRYVNHLFGISFELPEGWVVKGEAEADAEERARRIFSEENDPELRKAFMDSIDRTVFVLQAGKPVDSDAYQFSANLGVMREQIPTAIIRSVKDYYEVAILSFQRSDQVEIEVLEPFETFRVGDKELGTYKILVKSSAGAYVQRYVTILRSPYALAIVFAYLDEADESLFDDLVDSIRVEESPDKK